MSYPKKKFCIILIIFLSYFKIILSQENTIIASSELPLSEKVLDLLIPSQNIQEEQKYTFWNSFISGFSIILIAEIGDRTFILVMIYAVSNGLIKTFLISNFILLLWNYISIIIGYNIPLLVDKSFVEWVGIITFTFFGILMIRDGYYMENRLFEEEYLEEEKSLKNEAKISTYYQSLPEIDKNNKKSSELIINNENNLKENLIPKTQSTGINFKKNDVENNTKFEEKNVFDSFWVFGFTLLMGELGDNSQIVTIVLGATQNFYGVLLGTSLAHSLCTVIAILFGKLFSQYVTTKQITLIGGVMFLFFSALFLYNKI